MTARPDDSWQVQDAKQHFSELLRAAERDGTQFVTRHGDTVVAVVPIADYRHMTRGRESLTQHLLAQPRVSDRAATVFDEIAHERRNDLPHDIDLTA